MCDSVRRGHGHMGIKNKFGPAYIFVFKAVNNIITSEESKTEIYEYDIRRSIICLLESIMCF